MLFWEVGDLGGNVKTINEELNCFNEWCSYNVLTVNANKTKCLLFCPTPKKLRATLAKSNIQKFIPNNTDLKFAASYGYLGVELDQFLSFGKYSIQSQTDFILVWEN